MSQYPVTDSNQLYSAVNYLLAGPGGLGQNFAGFSDYQPAYVRGTFRKPFTVATTATNTSTNPIPVWTVNPISITSATTIAVNTATGLTNTVEIFFTPQTTPPFIIGDTVYVNGVTDTSGGGNNSWNGSYSRSVLYTTTSSVTLQTSGSYQYLPITSLSSATIQKSNIDTFVSTDCNARVTVTGPTDRVFISAQLSLNFTASCTTASQFDLVVAINRYIPTTTSQPAAGQDYTFNFDKTISQVVTHYSTSTGGTYSINAGSNIFTTVIDQPSFGYYWYIAEISFNTYDSSGNAYPGNATPKTFTVGLRSLTSQVIKA